MSDADESLVVEEDVFVVSSDEDVFLVESSLEEEVGEATTWSFLTDANSDGQAQGHAGHQ